MRWTRAELTLMSFSSAHAVRSDLRPGDLGRVVTLHGTVYASEYGFDITFEAYVAGPLAAFALGGSPRERLWLAEDGDQLVGCAAIVAADPQVAQLRWFLVAPGARRSGLGTRLLNEAIAFSRAADYDRVMLWTVSALETAAGLYRAAGFQRCESVAAHRWGAIVTEERYELVLRQ